MRRVIAGAGLGPGLALVLVSAVACNSTFEVAGGGPMGAGGAPGAGGAAGGAGEDAAGGSPDLSCLGDFQGCISTCGDADTIISPSPFCDERGQPQCPSGSQPAANCPPHSCALYYNPCCDPVTGALANAPCGADGIRGDCPANTAPAPSYACIPDGLGVTDCYDLNNDPCPIDGQRCRGGSAECECRVYQQSGRIWICTPFPPV